MKDGMMCYQGVPIDVIPLGTWEHMLKLEESNKNEQEIKEFFKIMIARSKKKNA